MIIRKTDVHDSEILYLIDGYKKYAAVYIIKLKDVCLDYVKSLNKTRMNKLPILKNLSPALKQKSTCSVETTHNNIKKRAETITRKVQLGGLPFV